MRFIRLVFILGSYLWFASIAQGSVFDYLSGYHVGVDYSYSADDMQGSYRIDTRADAPESCTPSTDDKQRCTFALPAGRSSGWGIFLQQPFKRQGDFHFDYDFGFGLRLLSGETTDVEEQKLAEEGLPLQNLSFQLIGAIIRPYVQVGWTPSGSWPDILFSIGPALQVALGQVTVNDETENTAVLTASRGLLSGYAELEIVLYRFGGGAISGFSAKDLTSSDDGSKLYPKTIDGMDDIRADFSRHVGGSLPFGMGLKILFNWP